MGKRILCLVGTPRWARPRRPVSRRAQPTQSFQRIALGRRDDEPRYAATAHHIGRAAGRVIQGRSAARVEEHGVLMFARSTNKIGQARLPRRPSKRVLEVLAGAEPKFRRHILGVDFDRSNGAVITPRPCSTPSAAARRMEIIALPGLHRGEKVEI